MSIVFRTHIRSRKNSHALSTQYMRRGGTECDDIREYMPGDSTRDLFWKKLNPAGTPHTKIRSERDSIEIIILAIENVGDHFCTETHPKSKHEYKKYCISLLERSAREQNIPLRVYVGGYNVITEIQKDMIQHSLIFVFHSNSENIFEQSLRKIRPTNDLIHIDILHPYEVGHHEPLMFLGKTLGQHRYTKYLQAFKTQRKTLEKERKRDGMSTVEVLTTDNFISRMNLFFKNRYG